MPSYRCRINRRVVELTSWDPKQPLLYALRARGLHGAKIGCGLGQCGTCTVLVSNEAVRSCVVPVESIVGKTIVTIEGLGSPATPDAVQAAFIAEQAAQCGYCTPGMILSTKALLARTPRPTVPQIKDALAGNLCRCGAYPRILRAVLRASEQRPVQPAEP
jgi:nicotinate dehydrogenase subunit A